MKGYLGIAKNSVIQTLVYRSAFFVSTVANIIVITITYYLWKAIYADVQTINGMTFNTAFITVALSSTIFSMISTYTDDEMCNNITSGSISQTLIKPVDYQLYLFSGVAGTLLLNMVIVALPSVLYLIFVFHVSIPIGWNLVFFAAAIVLTFLMNFAIDFNVGLISFYTYSSWGFSAAKSVTIMILSGAAVPLAFFPQWLRHVVDVLPFKSMFALPMQVLLSQDNDIPFYLKTIGSQIFWILLLVLTGRLFYKKAVKVVTVQGG